MMGDDETIAEAMWDHPELFPTIFGPRGNLLSETDCIEVGLPSNLRNYKSALPQLAIDLVFDHIIRVSAEDNRKPLEDVVKFEEHNEAAKRILKRTYSKLSSLYVDLRNFKHAAWCDRHTDEEHAPTVKREEFSCKLKKFKLEGFWRR